MNSHVTPGSLMECLKDAAANEKLIACAECIPKPSGTVCTSFTIDGANLICDRCKHAYGFEFE